MILNPRMNIDEHGREIGLMRVFVRDSGSRARSSHPKKVTSNIEHRTPNIEWKAERASGSHLR